MRDDLRPPRWWASGFDNEQRTADEIIAALAEGASKFDVSARIRQLTDPLRATVWNLEREKDALLRLHELEEANQ